MAKMSKPIFNQSGKHTAKPAHKDSHKVSAHGASDEVGHKKAAGGKHHKQISGPSEMKSVMTGKHHKGIEGPSEHKKPGHMFHDGKKLPVNHTADHVGGKMHDHLGEHGKVENLKKGHKSLEKVSVHEAAEEHQDGYNHGKANPKGY